MKVIKHSWKNGDDNSKLPVVTLLDNGHFFIESDGSTDADGSLNVGDIDPDYGQSCTSLGKENGWKGPNEYVDSESIPFFVLPLNWKDVTGVKCQLGDIAKLSYKDKVIYAIFADEGPRSIIGEASIFAIEALGGKPWNSAHTKIISGIPFGVTYEVIPNSAKLSRTVSNATIQAYGKELFEGTVTPTPQPVPTPQPTPQPTIEISKADNGDAVLTSLIGSVVSASADCSTVKAVKDFLGNYSNGTKVSVVNKATQPTPTPVPTPVPTSKKVLIDSGHSDSHPGATGKKPTVKEEVLNRFQATVLQEELAALGIKGDIYDPLNDALSDIGHHAAGYNAFVSLHLNAYDNREHYTCCLLHSTKQKPDSKSAKVASLWAQAVAEATGNECFDGSEGWPKGILAGGYGVLKAASETDCPIFFLSELEFVDDESDEVAIRSRIKAGLKAGAKILSENI